MSYENDKGGSMNLLTFLKGGVHPNDRKFSAASAIENIPLAEEFIFPMSQHIGCPASPVVKVGDKVLKGSILGQAVAACCANVHSSVVGIVKSVSPKEVVIKADNLEAQGIEGNGAGNEVKIETANKNLIDVIKEAGIVGLGGATFPTHVKLSPANPKDITAIVINAAECEPYLTADHRLLLEEGAAVIDGIKLIQSIFPSKPKAYIGIEANKRDAYDHLKTLIHPSDNIELCLLKTMYPQGGEKQLIQAILKKEVPSGVFLLTSAWLFRTSVQLLRYMKLTGTVNLFMKG
jgi:electron transport complex protein RnfC